MQQVCVFVCVFSYISVCRANQPTSEQISVPVDAKTLRSLFRTRKGVHEGVSPLDVERGRLSVPDIPGLLRLGVSSLHPVFQCLIFLRWVWGGLCVCARTRMHRGRLGVVSWVG